MSTLLGSAGRPVVPRRAAALVGIAVLLGSLLSSTAAAQDQVLPELTVADATAREGSRTMVFTLRLDRATDEDVEVAYATEPGTATGDVDYISTSGALLIPAGRRTGQVVVRLLEDALEETTETFELSVFTLSGTTIAGNILEATGTITDDDPAADLIIENGSASESVGNIAFAVWLRTVPDRTVTVDYATVNGTAVATRPGAPGDYESAAGTLEFPAGDPGPVYVHVNLVADSVDEEHETFGLKLTNASNATAPSDAATGVILDSNPEPIISVDDVEGEEGETFTFTVTLSDPSAREVNVRFEARDGSALVGEDYVATRGLARFRPGITRRTVSVPTLNDPLVEDDSEVFWLEVRSIAYDSQSLPNGMWGRGFIIDNDEPGEPPDTRRRGGGGSGGGGGGGGGGAVGSGSGGGGGGTLSRPAGTPRLGVLLKDTVLRLDGPPVEVDLSAALSGSRGSFRALAADPRIVTAVASGSRVTLSPVALGSTIVLVSLTNDRGSALQSFRVTVVGQGAPRITSPLPGRVLYVTDPPTVIDVGTAFGGSVNSYRATARDPRLVTAVLSGSSLSLTGLTPGATTVSVVARNSSGEAMQTFMVTVRTR